MENCNILWGVTVFSLKRSKDEQKHSNLVFNTLYPDGEIEICKCHKNKTINLSKTVQNENIKSNENVQKWNKIYKQWNIIKYTIKQ